MKQAPTHSIPTIDPNSRLIQFNPRKLAIVRKEKTSSQRNSARQSLRKIPKKVNENEDYCQQEQMIEDKYHLMQDISSLKEEVAEYNKQIQAFIQSNQKDKTSSSLSTGSKNSLSLLSTQISELDEELAQATAERKETSKHYCAETESKLEEEIETQMKKIETISSSINTTNEKLKTIRTELLSPEIIEATRIGEERRQKIYELSSELARLDEIEEQLTQEMQNSLDKISAPVKSLALLDRLTHKYQHLVYERTVKEKERSILSQKHKDQISKVSDESAVSSRKNSQKQMKNECKKVPPKSGTRVTFNVPPELGIPCKRPPIYYQQNYAYAYYDDKQDYYEYDYYEYDPEEEELYEPLIGQNYM